MNDKTLNPTIEIKSGSLANYTVNPQVNEKQFDEFTALIANLCGMPKAVITLIDGDKLWFKSSLGMSNDFVYFKKSFCQFTIDNNMLIEISDVDSDPRLVNHDWTNEYPLVKFYAGVPLITSEDGMIGTLCIMDSVPRVLTCRQKEMLLELGKMVSSLMESRRSNRVVKSEGQRPTEHPMVSLRAMRSITRSW